MEGIGRFRPSEGFGFAIVDGQVVFGRGLEVFDAGIGIAFDVALADQCEETFGLGLRRGRKRDRVMRGLVGRYRGSIILHNRHCAPNMTMYRNVPNGRSSVTDVLKLPQHRPPTIGAIEPPLSSRQSTHRTP